MSTVQTNSFILCHNDLAADFPALCLPFVLVKDDPNLDESGISFSLGFCRERDSAIAFKVRITPTPQKRGGENPRYGHRIITIYWACLGRQGYCV